VRKDRGCRRVVLARVLAGQRASTTNPLLMPGVEGTPVTINPHPPISTADSDGDVDVATVMVWKRLPPMSDGQR